MFCRHTLLGSINKTRRDVLLYKERKMVPWEVRRGQKRGMGEVRQVVQRSAGGQRKLVGEGEGEEGNQGERWLPWRAITDGVRDRIQIKVEDAGAGARSGVRHRPWWIQRRWRRSAGAGIYR